MAIIECPHCRLTISPRPNGECPACHRDTRVDPAKVGDAQDALTCPFCREDMQPISKQQITAPGYIICFVLLLFCLPLCWIGLLVQETILCCNKCGAQLGS